jgi:CheY-like chemotaxis protein
MNPEPFEELNPAGQAPAGADAAEFRRVLVLEDDPAFREVITDFLAECGYTVVAVQNGAEGVREVMASDFGLILCDMQMPAMPGDMFYRAVERLRPRLCERFVFMTGNRGVSPAGEFIKKVNGYVLQKPFQLKALMDSISYTEVRRNFRSVFDTDGTEAVSSQVSPPADSLPKAEVPAPRVLPVPAEVSKPVTATEKDGDAQERIPPRTSAQPPLPSPLPVVLAASEPQPRTRVVSRTLVFAGIGILLVQAAALGSWYLHARDRAAAAVAERLAREAEWTAISAPLEEALAAQPKFASAQSVPALILADRAKPRWTPALPCIVPPGDARIDIVGVDARGVPQDSGACEVRVHGVAGGAQPRLAADHFRQSVEDNLKRNANGRPVTVHFEQLEEPTEEVPGEPRANFVMIATLGSMQPSSAPGEENR